ncbi:MAG TPA: trehalose-6-phosphate synthase [Candidatus Obscuribacterales bacterium]
MHIVSYRGPGKAGGVSAALARAWECNFNNGGLWWHLTDNTLEVSSSPHTPAIHIADLPTEVIEGHYRYCNDFLWPIMHDLPQYARYISEDRASYNTFNQQVGWCLARAQSHGMPHEFFVQDYQLSLLPRFLKKTGYRTVAFWHIPWPKHVDDMFAAAIEDVAIGLLSTDAIGFHTQEYADNFARFVQQRLPEFNCSADGMTIWSGDKSAYAELAQRVEPGRYAPLRQRATGHTTKLVVAPLGIDFDNWARLAADQRNTLWHPALMRTPFVLSVDRADYTKGVTDRIRSIDAFFERHPEWRERIVFAQICGKTRPGLQSFDEYWKECQQLYAHLQERWATESWQPLVWLETSFSPADLAHAYRTAAAMLISAVRDGLNLTAKEYIACQGERPGVLALSSGTGAWNELSEHTVALQPRDANQMSEAIFQALSMDAHERAWRMAMLKDAVRSNSLNRWWFTFSTLAGATQRSGGYLPAQISYQSALSPQNMAQRRVI